MKLGYLECHDDFKNRHHYRITITPTLFGNHALVREWGRIGSGGQRKEDWFPTEIAALEAGLKIRMQKRKKGYGYGS